MGNDYQLACQWQRVDDLAPDASGRHHHCVFGVLPTLLVSVDRSNQSAMNGCREKLTSPPTSARLRQAKEQTAQPAFRRT